MMTNKEKYAQEILDIVCDGNNVAIIGNKPCKCQDNCDQCELHKLHSKNCLSIFNKWCNMEYEECKDVDWLKVHLDAKIYVRDSIWDEWLPRYFAFYRNESVYAYHSGATSWSTSNKTDKSRWNYAKLAED